MGEITFYFEKDGFVLANKISNAKNNGTLVFRNKMNSVLFPVNFTARDYDVFFTICWYAKRLGYVETMNFIEMPYSEICKFMPQNLNKTRFNDELKLFVNKILGRDGTAVYRSVEVTDDDEVTSVGVFFTDIKLFRNKQILRFKLNPIALNILFGVLNFMKIDLNNFVSIRGKFAKTIYRLLLQYENIKPDENGFKCVNFSSDDFINFMNAPDSYDCTDLERRAIIPSISELNENYFKKILFEKKFDNKNKNIIGYSFKFMLCD